jgi:FlaA1/EpsC-like NDP-sugar epimerase
MKNIFLKSSIHIIFVCIAMLLVTGCTQNSSVTHIQSDVTDTKILENIQEQDKVIENSADIQAAPVGKNNSKKVIMVTGTASGIGKATAEKLIANGHIVY